MNGADEVGMSKQVGACRKWPWAAATKAVEAWNHLEAWMQ